MHRDMKTYNCILLFLSSSSLSCFSCISTSVFSEATEGDGLVGRGKEFALEDPILWLSVSVSAETALEGDNERCVIGTFAAGTSKFPLPNSDPCG